MGELFNTQHEYVPLITGSADRLHPHPHLADRRPEHGAQGGGALAKFFGVQTAWHGPGDVSPVGHAARLALELASYNFGIHEGGASPTETRRSSPAAPRSRTATCYANEAPGLGIDLDEKLAAKFPITDRSADLRAQLGHDAPTDGTVIRP